MRSQVCACAPLRAHTGCTSMFLPEECFNHALLANTQAMLQLCLKCFKHTLVRNCISLFPSKGCFSYALQSRCTSLLPFEKYFSPTALKSAGVSSEGSWSSTAPVDGKLEYSQKAARARTTSRKTNRSKFGRQLELDCTC